MKTLSKVFIFLSLFCTFTIPALGANYDYNNYTENWEIKSFHSDITINPDGQINVTENILADFTNEYHKGIARTIPYEYTNDYIVDIEFLSAKDQNGISWDNEVYSDNGYLNIDMYNLGRTNLTSEATFVLNYTANNVITFFDEEKAKAEDIFAHDELYWNVNGTEWVVPIKKSSATIHLPKAFEADQINTLCYTGTYASIDQNCTINQTDPQTLEFKTTQPLNAYENLTVIIGMPYGTIPPPPPPSFLEQLWEFITIYFGILLVGLTLLVMFLLWHTYGRDDQSVSDTIMPHYTPPKGMSPAETGTIIDEKLDPKDITSTIIDFAVRGYMQINELEEKGILFKSTDYELELIKEYPPEVKPFEKIILSAIFTNNKIGEKTKLSALKDKFYTHLPEIEKSIMSQLITDDYFPHNPANIRKLYGAIGAAFLITAFFFGEILTELLGASLLSLMGIGASGVIIILFGMKMPRKSRKGTETYYQLKGLYEYINTAEKDRMHFQEDQSIMFEKLLPYAMAFGLIDKWAKVFDGLIQNPPSWYHTNRPWGANGFTMIYFATRLSSISNQFNQNITSRPGGKGGGGSWGGGSGFSGGFSGGGFGGGGGRGL